MKIATSQKFAPITVTIILETEYDAIEFANFCNNHTEHVGNINYKLWQSLPEHVKALAD